MKSTAYPLGVLKQYKYVVVFARHQNRWVFCRHATRATWEAPGGHIEPGEAPEQAAQRELQEETGAIRYTLTPVCDYWACREPHEVQYECERITHDNGQVFLAEIEEMGPLPPGSEMGEVALFDDLPERLTYPDIAWEIFPAISRATLMPVTEACISPLVMPAPSPMAYRPDTPVSNRLSTSTLDE